MMLYFHMIPLRMYFTLSLSIELYFRGFRPIMLYLTEQIIDLYYVPVVSPRLNKIRVSLYLGIIFYPYFYIL